METIDWTCRWNQNVHNGGGCLLNKLNENAFSALVGNVTDAVINVSAYSNSTQREATKPGAHISGLNTLRIINEPTVAALAYYGDESISDNRKGWVYDPSGDTFALSALAICVGEFVVKSTNEDVHLGDQDFDHST
ncbi:uncharacterized protein DEA37_0003897 [Paragonimus westermani]|uniref:Uncharacterized protein n=1 Tax=Paragonimus westermani TaxID=34504 RepID=A0A5J4NWT2_9TREM|nr:uncharacterized protein DEA37_0003897 [Paragonimus westermani]